MNTPTILPGTVINGCKVIKEIGAGGMGTVYKGIDEILSRNVAIKIMHQPGPNSTGKARFLREASAIANLDHKGIIKIYSYGEHENRPFFVMEYVNGWSLKDFISRYNYIHNSGTNPEDLRLAGYIKENDINGQFFLHDHTENLTQDQIYPKKVRKLL
ncbi:MAG: protein kinase, partial [Candidatus Riflebacteria bacterium]|nr:protein kinase [Candidatus Riflebacteria bacterium]